MLGIEHYWSYVIACILLNISPGADTMYILTRSIAQGRKAGFYSVYGIASGSFIHTLLAAMGLSVILAQSPVAFTIVKYCGVAYLVYLGIKMMIDKNNAFESSHHEMGTPDLKRIYRQGMLTNVLNPKVALFFLAFMPQFINPQLAQGPWPFLFLGLTFMTTGTLWCLFLAYSASQITQTLRNNDNIGKWLQKVSGLVFVGLGLKLLMTRQ